MTKFNPIYTKNEINLIYYMNARKELHKVWYSFKNLVKDHVVRLKDKDTQSLVFQSIAKQMAVQMGLPANYPTIKAIVGLLKKVK